MLKLVLLIFIISVLLFLILFIFCSLRVASISDSIAKDDYFDTK